MASLKTFAIVYVLGGLTFLPLVLLLIFAWAAYTLPRRDIYAEASKTKSTGISRSLDESSEQNDTTQSLPDELRSRSHEQDISAGYFAVCREYVPGGVNGKPPERTTPAGEIVAAESPSVYQSMYRSIFDRNKVQGPTVIEGSRPTKRARNVFYVVLRHGHLVLFDDSEQLEVRYVVALMHYDVDVYAGGEEIPDGELWVKRNCIRLKKKLEGKKESSPSAPYYLFSENCSEKEDFYHTLLRNQAHESSGDDDMPLPLHFESEDMIKLVRQLHGSEETFQSRWMNAVIGRMFLALYKTSDIEDLVRWKITKKISRVSKPAFITSLQLQDVDMGSSAPVITNPKLRELTLEGDLTIEADVKYNGNFKLQIAAVARIDLGSRFKAREVDLVLAGIFKKLEGHMLFRIKPPPSNRVWFTFETMPKIDISIEPIVSTRQITYGFILRAIESRIREVFGETLVMPNWDDSPFTNTTSEHFRGGIWEHNRSNRLSLKTSMDITQAASEYTSSLPTEAEIESFISLPNQEIISSKSKHVQPPTTISTLGLQEEISPAAFKGEDSSITSEKLIREEKVEKPKALRSNSFATIATPVISRGLTSPDTARLKLKRRDRDATSAMKILSTKSSEASPSGSPLGSPPGLELKQDPKDSINGSTLFHESPFIPKEDENPSPGGSEFAIGYRGTHKRSLTDEAMKSASPVSTTDDHASIYSKSSSNGTNDVPSRSSTLNSHERRKQINDSFNIATAAAKKWGLGVLARQTESRVSTVSTENGEMLNKPIGRGQPLPPPGVPLPRPISSGWSVPTLLPLKKRLEPSVPPLPSRPKRKPVTGVSSPRRSFTTPTLNAETIDDGKDENLQVVSAPIDSTPTSPSKEESQEAKGLTIIDNSTTCLSEEPSQITGSDLVSHGSNSSRQDIVVIPQEEDESFDAWDTQEESR